MSKRKSTNLADVAEKLANQAALDKAAQNAVTTATNATPVAKETCMFFEGVEKQRGETVYIPRTPGKYKLKITSMKRGKSIKGQEYMLVEFKVLESSNPALPAKTTATYYVGKNGLYPGIALKQAQMFISGVGEVDQAEITEAHCNQIFDEQLFIGKVVNLVTTDRLTPKSKITVPVYTWSVA